MSQDLLYCWWSHLSLDLESPLSLTYVCLPVNFKWCVVSVVGGTGSRESATTCGMLSTETNSRPRPHATLPHPASAPMYYVDLCSLCSRCAILILKGEKARRWSPSVRESVAPAYHRYQLMYRSTLQPPSGKRPSCRRRTRAEQRSPARGRLQPAA